MQVYVQVYLESSGKNKTKRWYQNVPLEELQYFIEQFELYIAT